MEENKVKDLINALNLVNEQMVQKKEISTIAVAVKLEGLDQINEELDKVLIHKPASLFVQVQSDPGSVLYRPYHMQLFRSRLFQNKTP